MNLTDYEVGDIFYSPKQDQYYILNRTSYSDISFCFRNLIHLSFLSDILIDSLEIKSLQTYINKTLNYKDLMFVGCYFDLADNIKVVLDYKFKESNYKKKTFNLRNI